MKNGYLIINFLAVDQWAEVNLVSVLDSKPRPRRYQVLLMRVSYRLKPTNYSVGC